MYLESFLRSPEAQLAIDAMKTGGNESGLNLTHGRFSKLPTPLPPLAEQRRIVETIEALFSVLDAGVGYLVTGLNRLKNLQRAAIARAIDGSLAHEPSSGWTLVSVREITASMDYGTSAKTLAEATKPSDIPVLRMGNIQDGKLDLSNLKYLSSDHLDFPSKILSPGDVLFNRTNSAELVGKTAVYKGSPAVSSFASYLIRIRTSEEVLPDWLALCVNSPQGRRYIASVQSQQVGQANVNGTKLSQMPIRVPSLDVQERILVALDSTNAAVESCKAEIVNELQRASSLRRSILSSAFSGKLVPQDLNDEPASVLLERIAAVRASSEPVPRRRRARTTAGLSA
jgi:type I restriction enzyme S subunit